MALASFAATGGECKNCGMLRAGESARCPFCGGEMRRADLREAFTMRAIQQNAHIQLIEASKFLQEHEGVSALLRYRDNVSREQQALSSTS